MPPEMLKPTTLTVTPIPASESRTLRLSWRTTWITTIAAVMPDLLNLFFTYIWSDPKLAGQISQLVPPQFRYLFGVIIIVLAQKYGQLRKDTNAPIIGTAAAQPPADKTGDEKKKDQP